MDALGRRELAIAYVNQSFKSHFPDVYNDYTTQKKKFSEIPHGLAANALGHGFDWGLQHAETYPQFDGDIVLVAEKYGHEYALRQSIVSEHYDLVVSALSKGFAAGLEHGLKKTG